MSNTSESEHVGPITFANETARKQLVEHGEVVTFRRDTRTTGKTWWRKSRTGPKCGDVEVEWLKDVCPHGTGLSLEPFLDRSGFNSVHHWQQAIRAENGEMPAEGELYLVRDVDTDLDHQEADDGDD